MKGMIRVVSLSAVLLGASGALAEEARMEEAPFQEIDTRTEEQKLEDAEREAWNNAQIEELMASTASAPATFEEEAADEAAGEPGFFPANEYTGEQATELLRAAEPETFSSLVGPPVQLRGCWYFISTRPEGRWGPPLYRLIVQRLPSQHCEAKTVVNNTTSYWGGAVVATKESKGMAIAIPMKATPSGSALVHTYIYSLEPKEMQLKREGFLGTYRGSTTVREMHFEGNRLHVDVWRYVAIYPRFLTHDVPPSGVIFP